MASDDIPAAFASFAGAKRFNEFLAALSDAAAGRRRLRYWQESLWADFAAATPGVNPSPSFEELESLFQGQSRQPLVLTREEFLTDPSRHWLDPHVTVQPGWVADAWSQEQFRQNMTYLLVRSVSKTGSLDLAGDAVEVLAAELNKEQVAALYLAVREESGRSEREWRSDFKHLFAGKLDQLPPSVS